MRASIVAARHGLLRRHVVRRADDHVRLRRVAADVALQAREAEIEDANALAVPDLLADHDVRGLHVAVEHFLLVRVREARQRSGARSRAPAVGGIGPSSMQRAQRDAVDEVHHQVRRALPHAEVEDGDAVRVIELAHHPRLAIEPRLELAVVGERRVEELDRDELADRNALGLVDRAHRARRHHLGDLVAPVDEAPDRDQRLRRAYQPQ